MPLKIPYRRRLSVELLEDRRMLTAGVTIITHGTQFFSSSLPDWTVTLGQAILDRADGASTAHNTGSMFEHDPATGLWQPVPSSIWSNSNKADEAIVLLYDWADESDTFADGWLEAAADNLFAGLVGVNSNLPGALANTSFVDLALTDGGGNGLVDMHFIGHSRGAVLNSLVTERFEAYLPDLTIDQVTTLDPHPAGPMDDPGYVSSSPSANSRVFTYDNARFADNYYQQDGSYEPLLTFDFDGVRAEGAYNFQIPSSVLKSGGGSLSHSDVHTWYYGTVTATLPSDYAGYSGATRNNDGDASFPDSWYGASGVPARTATGFAFSEIGGANRDDLPVSGAKSPPGRIPSVFNGDVSYGTPGWTEHGGGGSAPVAGSGDQYFQLSAGGDDYYRRHNALYFDRYADGVAYDYWINTAAANGADDVLQVLVGGNVIDTLPLTGTTSGFVRGRIGSLGVARDGFAATLEFRLVDVAGDGLQSAVRIDNASVVESPPAVSADLDGNAIVDGADFLNWQRGFGTYLHATRPAGDADDDGNVLPDDLAVWRASYGDASTIAAVQTTPATAAQIDAALEAFALGGAGAAPSVTATFSRRANH
jgi:hypothetical protein